MSASDIAATGMTAAIFKMKIEAGNIANAKTPGFYGKNVTFKDNLYLTPAVQDINPLQSPGQIEVGTGVSVNSAYRNLSQGVLEKTDSPYDFAIEGQGYFEITPLDGGETFYARSGNFNVNSQRQIVTPQGHFLGAAPITVPENVESIRVEKNGTIWATVSGEVAAQNIGAISLATFNNPNGLESVGDNLYRATEFSGQAEVQEAFQGGAGKIIQGYLEASNVELMKEMVAMIDSQLHHQILGEVIKKDTARKESEITLARSHG